MQSGKPEKQLTNLPVMDYTWKMKKQNALENLGFVLENASCGHTPCIAPDMDAINVTWQLEWPEVQIMQVMLCFKMLILVTAGR